MCLSFYLKAVFLGLLGALAGKGMICLSMGCLATNGAENRYACHTGYLGMVALITCLLSPSELQVEASAGAKLPTSDCFVGLPGGQSTAFPCKSVSEACRSNSRVCRVPWTMFLTVLTVLRWLDHAYIERARLYYRN